MAVMQKKKKEQPSGESSMHYKCCEIAVYLVRMNGFYCRSQCGGGSGSGDGDVGCTTSVVVLITDCRRIAWCHSS
jgi:hypothetical protein